MSSSRDILPESPLVKTKIIATVGPACAERAKLRALVEAGVDVFRLNFAHGSHEWLEEIVRRIRSVSEVLGKPIAILGDLSGPKIRLGQLPEEGITCEEGVHFRFVREADPEDEAQLTCTYPQLIDDVTVGERILLADGRVEMQVLETPADGESILCAVTRPGILRSKQGVNLPGTVLSTPSLTEKDRRDLAWALANGLDFVGLSFVRSAEDIRQLRQAIADHKSEYPPHIIAKIEKLEAVDDLERILERTDAVMVARGDLGVEVDIERVPTLQKRIIRMCNEHRVPVITATQMLDSMEDSEFPTRAEASDVANAVLDGSDAVMLSGETAIGAYPVEAVAMMSRIAREAERLVVPGQFEGMKGHARTRARAVTEAVAHGAGAAAEHLDADLIVVGTHSGKTAMAVSNQRGRVPIVAMSNRPDTARRLCLYWGITAVDSPSVQEEPENILNFVVGWGWGQGLLKSGSRIVLITGTNWSAERHDMMLIHVVS